MAESPSLDETRLREVRYLPPDGFGFDLVTRLGEAVSYSELEIEVKIYDDVPIRAVTPRTLWWLKKDTVRPIDLEQTLNHTLETKTLMDNVLGRRTAVQPLRLLPPAH